MSREIVSIRRLGFLLMIGASSLAVTGCEEKGPAEKAGENVDKGVQNLKNAVDPAGPAEKAGRAVDNAVNK